MLIRLILGIILQYVEILSHPVVHLKLIQCYLSLVSHFEKRSRCDSPYLLSPASALTKQEAMCLSPSVPGESQVRVKVSRQHLVHMQHKHETQLCCFKALR